MKNRNVEFLIYLAVYLCLFPVLLFGQYQTKSPLLTAFVKEHVSDSVFNLVEFQLNGLEQALGSGSVEAVIKREGLQHLFSTHVLVGEVLENMNNGQIDLSGVNDELNQLGLRFSYLEGYYYNLLRTEMPPHWKGSCRCMPEILYSDILACTDANADSEYPFYGLDDYFTLLSKADTFLLHYPKHEYASTVMEKSTDCVSVLSDIHKVFRDVIYVGSDLPGIDTVYVQGGIATDLYPGHFDLLSYQQLLSQYKGRYARLLQSRVEEISTVHQKCDTMYVLVAKPNRKDEFPNVSYHNITIVNAEYSKHKVVKFHSEKAVLQRMQEARNCILLKAVRKSDSSIAIIK